MRVTKPQDVVEASYVPQDAQDDAVHTPASGRNSFFADVIYLFKYL